MGCHGGATTANLIMVLNCNKTVVKGGCQINNDRSYSYANDSIGKIKDPFYKKSHLDEYKSQQFKEAMNE